VSNPAPSLHTEGKVIRVSGPVKRRLEELQAERSRDLDRAVTFSEVIEQLLPPRGDKP
jgi:hypothetical protein